MPDCSRCGHSNPEGARFCGSCGSALAPATVRCPGCAAENVASQSFCNVCGHRLDSAAHAADGAMRIEGERKQVTVMFVDIVRSMDLTERVETERWRALVERFFVTVSRAVQRVQGTMHQFTGDGVLALFGAPVAHEDHAQRACLAALDLHAGIEPIAQELARDGLTFKIRVGLNSGEVIVGEIGDEGQLDYTAIGHTMGMAQRMESLAPHGSTAMSASTAKLAAREFDLRELGDFEVKGSSVPRRVYELVGKGHSPDLLAATGTRGGVSPFVGREREWTVLEEALERALAGEGQVVGLMGEPGVGKSRLADEFAQRCEADEILVLHVRAPAHGRQAPLLPVLELMRASLDIAESDEPAAARARISELLRGLDARFEEALPLLFEFLGVPDPDRPSPNLDPDARQRELLAFVRRFVRARSVVQPAVIVLEDLHWLDDASGQFLAELVRTTAGTRTLLILTYRPEYPAEILRGSHCEQLALRPLAKPVVERLIASLLGTDQSLDGLGELIAGRAVGNPFFCEELVAALTEGGYLTGERGAYKLMRTLEGLMLPASVQATLGARIDRLHEREKELLQLASVLGHELSESVLAEISGLPADELADALEALVTAELLTERATEAGIEYAFKHPLTQEVAYRSQLTERRRHLHQQVALAIKRLYPDKLDERAALVARHCEAAGEVLAAARWHMRAAIWIGLSDTAQATAHWRKVAELADPVATSPEAAMLSRLAHVRQLDYGWRLGMSDEEATIHYERARRILEQVGDPVKLAGLIALYATVRGMAGHVQDYETLSEEACRRSAEIGDPTLRIVTLVVVMQARLSRGRIDDALAAAEEAIELGADSPLRGARESSLVCPYAWCLMFRGWILCDAGRPLEAAETLDRGLEIAKAYNDIETQGWAHMLHVAVARDTGRVETTLAHALEAFGIGERAGAAFSRAWQMYYLGYARLLVGETADAIDAIERSIEIARGARTALEQEPIRLASLSEALIAGGQTARALQVARESVEIALERGNAGNVPYCYRVLAEALLASDPHSVEAKDALEIARTAAETTGALVDLPRIERARATLVGVS